MKNYYFAVALLTAAFSTAIAQSEEHKHCYTTEKLQDAIRRDPTVAQRMAQLEDFTRTWIADKAQQRSQGGIYIIPVVFHVLHNYGQENINDAQIIDAVRVMNEDFRLLNADTNLIIPQFNRSLPTVNRVPSGHHRPGRQLHERYRSHRDSPDRRRR